MFKILRPQKVQHDSGYIVQSDGRYALKYLDGDLVVKVETDIGPVTGIYSDLMTITKAGVPFQMSPDDRQIILNRIGLVMDFWKTKYEFCKKIK